MNSDQITISLIVLTGLVDSINPCAIGVLVFLLSTLIALSRDHLRMLIAGFVYIIAVYITYFLAGLGLIWFVQKWNIVEELGIVVGFLIIILGFIELKDFFWYGKGFSLSISEKHMWRIKKIARHATFPGLIALGFFVAAIELPCTGGPYLAITTYLAKHPFDAKGIAYLILYNFIFVLPLIVIVFAVYYGTRITFIQRWKESYRRWMRLATGLLMIGLGILLILYAKGLIRIGI